MAHKRQLYQLEDYQHDSNLAAALLPHTEPHSKKARNAHFVATYHDFVTLWDALAADDDHKDGAWGSPHDEKLLSDLITSLEDEIREVSSHTSNSFSTATTATTTQTSFHSEKSTSSLSSEQKPPRELFVGGNTTNWDVSYFASEEEIPSDSLRYDTEEGILSSKETEMGYNGEIETLSYFNDSTFGDGSMDQMQFYIDGLRTGIF